MKRNFSKLLAFAVVLSMVLSTVCIVPMTASAAEDVDYGVNGYAAPINIPTRNTKLYVEDGASSEVIGTTVGARQNATKEQSLPADYDAAVEAVAALGGVVVKDGVAVATSTLLPKKEIVESNSGDSMFLNAYATPTEWNTDAEGKKTTVKAGKPGEYGFDLSGKFIKGVAFVGVGHSTTTNFGVKLQFNDDTWTNDGNCALAPAYASNVATSPIVTTKKITYNTDEKTYATSDVDYNVGFTVVNFDEESGNTKPAKKVYFHTGVTTGFTWVDGVGTPDFVPETITGVTCQDAEGKVLHDGTFFALSNLYEIEYSFEELEPLMEAKIAEVNEMETGAAKDELLTAITATILSAEKRGMDSSAIEGWNELKTTVFKATVKPYAKNIDFKKDVSMIVTTDADFTLNSVKVGSKPAQIANSHFFAQGALDMNIVDGVYTANGVDYSMDNFLPSATATGNVNAVVDGVNSDNSPKTYTMTGDKFIKEIHYVNGSNAGVATPLELGSMLTFNDSVHTNETVATSFTKYSMVNKADQVFVTGKKAGYNSTTSQFAKTNTTEAFHYTVIKPEDGKAFVPNTETITMATPDFDTMVGLFEVEYGFSELADEVIPEIVNRLYTSYTTNSELTDAEKKDLTYLDNTIASATIRGFVLDDMADTEVVDKYYELSPKAIKGVKFDNATVVLTSDAPEYSAIATDVPVGTTVEYTCNGATQEEPFVFNTVGKYEVTVRVSKEGYPDFVKTATFIIKDEATAGLIDFESADDLDLLTLSGLGNDKVDKIEIVADPDNASNHVLKVTMAENVSNAPREAGFRVATNDVASAEKPILVSFEMKLGNLMNGHGFSEFGTPVNGNTSVGYSCKQGGWNWTNTANMMRFSDPASLYKNVIANVSYSFMPNTAAMKKYDFVTNFSGKTYGQNRDLSVLVDGVKLPMNTIESAEADKLKGNITSNTYENIQFRFISRASTTDNPTQDGQIYYIDNINVRRLPQFTVTTDANANAIDPTQNIVFTTTDAVDDVSANSLVLKDEDGYEIPVVKEVSQDGKTITVKTAGVVDYNNSYTLEGTLSTKYAINADVNFAFKTIKAKSVNMVGTLNVTYTGTSLAASTAINGTVKVTNPETTEMDAWIAFAAYDQNNKMLKIDCEAFKIAANAKDVEKSFSLTDVPLGTKVVRAFIWDSPETLNAYQMPEEFTE